MSWFEADELRALRETVRQMLKENGEPPREGKWADIAVLEPVRDYKARHASTLLTFDAVGRRHRPDRGQAGRQGRRQDRGGVRTVIPDCRAAGKSGIHNHRS
jgi:hypothetical protein